MEGGGRGRDGGAANSILSLLVQSGANLDQVDNHGLTPMLLAGTTGRVHCRSALFKASGEEWCIGGEHSCITGG